MENRAGAELETSLSSEEEALEFSTTVDPSYVIRLIRQLLPSLDKETVQDENLGMDMQSDKDAEPNNALQISNEVTDVGESCSEMVEGNIEDTNGKSESAPGEEDNALEKKVDNEIDDSLSFSTGVGDGSSCQKDISSPKFSDSIVASQVTEDQREEAGCMLWDLAATQSHAEFMVKNHILDVLLAILGVPHSDRIREICLGIMGNLACHAIPVKAIIHTTGLPSKIIQNLFVDDAPSLSEACRLLSASLHSEEVDGWVKVIKSQDVLQRIMWIAANTTNLLLLEKSTELLLAMVDCQGNTASVLSNLVELGLPSVITDILFSEISAFNEGTCAHGSVVLDTVLQIAESLSLADDVAGQLADNITLFNLSCHVIRLSAKDEVGPAGISAAVLLANLLAEKEELIHQLASDVVLIKQFLKLLPSAGDDPGARNALWSILSRLSLAHSKYHGSNANHSDLRGVNSNHPEDQGPNSNSMTQVALALASGCDMLLEDLLDDQNMEELDEADDTTGFNSKLETVWRFLQVMEDRLTACSANAQISDVHGTIKSACCLLREGLEKIDEKGMHPKRDDEILKHNHHHHQNGVIHHER